jgi:hypothetical protein
MCCSKAPRRRQRERTGAPAGTARWFAQPLSPQRGLIGARSCFGTRRHPASRAPYRIRGSSRRTDWRHRRSSPPPSTAPRGTT